ncbi:hydrolase [Pontibacillus sp. HMF3514]|uniref:hydrolase n=1 Tax=Pontibacillus sp. HMF3514 TaxID=2692425 RepID=UPI0013201E48|nr:hydrolase [Pontibacillus sp. HMF3514]QHE53336.1 hydrolase [Pontibacillus sp. HMF3514]
MEEEKKTFYINLGSQEISQIKEGNNDAFTIQATEEEMFRLRQVLNEVFNADERSFWRSHIPFRHYSKDEDNDEYDYEMRHAYQMIYDLGDEKTKAFIEEIGMKQDEEPDEVYDEKNPLE